MQVKKQQLEPDMEQQSMPKLYVKAVCCCSDHLTYMQSMSCKMLDWMNQTGIKIAGRNINNLRYADDMTLIAESKERTKEPLDEGERGE